MANLDTTLAGHAPAGRARARLASSRRICDLCGNAPAPGKALCLRCDGHVRREADRAAPAGAP